MMVKVGKLIAEGKTKQIFAIPDMPWLCAVRSKDDITAGDGARHDVLHGKGELCTRMTCNVFRLLKRRGLNVAYYDQPGLIDSRTFMAARCEMIPLEVVVRGRAYGSYLKRYPSVAKGVVFDEPLVEFYLKTTNRRWKNKEIPVDDPFIVFDYNGTMQLHRPGVPFAPHDSFLEVSLFDVIPGGRIGGPRQIRRIASQAKEAFQVLSDAWSDLGGLLIDLKMEFGGQYIADVITNDEWRLIIDGKDVSKQAYRDGAPLDEVLANYKLVADLTDKFA